MTKNATLMKLETLMSQKQWTVYRLAKESCIPYSSLNNLFQRNTEPTLPTLRKICEGLGISLSDFFSDETTRTVTEFSSEERKLVTLYHNLRNQDKKLLMTYAQALCREIPDFPRK